jgi:hypothetical protein
MPGNPQFTCPPPHGFLPPIEVDLLDIVIEQPAGTPVVQVDSTQQFFVSATLKVGGFAALLPLPYTIIYYFTGFGGAGAGSLGSTVGLVLSAGGVFIPGCGLAKDYAGAVTQVAVPANTLVQDQSYQITAVADFPLLNNVDAFSQPKMIGTSP